MTPGDPAVKDAYGLILNAALPCIEQTAAGVATIDLTGLTSYALTVANDAPDQARQAMLLFTGTPTGPCTVTIPSVARIGWVSNQSSQNVLLATATATSNLTVSPGSSFLYLCDGAAVSAVPLGGSGVLSAAAGVNISNSTSYYSANDPNGVSQPLLSLGAAGWTNLWMGGSTGWRVISPAGTAFLVIQPSGDASFIRNLGVGGALAAANVNATIGSIGGVTFSGGGGVTAGPIVSTGNITATNQVTGAIGHFTNLVSTVGSVGGVSFSGSGGVTTPGSISALGFITTSDRRAKAGIADLSPEDGYDWIGRARPRSYTMDGRFQAGFVAQEDIDNGRGAAVVAIADDHPEFAKSDGYAPAGSRLARNYQHDIALLTAALQGALARIATLEARTAAPA